MSPFCDKMDYGYLWSIGSCNRGMITPLDHGHFVACLVVGDLIHEGSHQHQATTALLLQITRAIGGGYACHVESRPLVANDELGFFGLILAPTRTLRSR